MKAFVTPEYEQGKKGDCEIRISQRNLEMLQKYGAIHKGLVPLFGSMQIIVEPNEVHYSKEQEEAHQKFTDPALGKGN